MSLREAIDIVFAHEGGNVDDPDDLGGRTGRGGITQNTYDNWRREKGLNIRDVWEITDDEIEDIYLEHYWAPGYCDMMSWPLNLIHFDGCINHGVKGATKILQRAAGVSDDGAWGPITEGAVLSQHPDSLSESVLWERVRFYNTIAKAGQLKFLRGWINRVLGLREKLWV